MIITDHYKDQLKQMHDKIPSWGSEGGKYANEILGFTGHDCSILDYGCGKGKLKVVLDKDMPEKGVECFEFDPGIPGKDECPVEEVDYVVSRDVLEHIEPDCIEHVLWHISTLASKGVWFQIHTKKAGAILPDGRNAHLIQEGLEWWSDMLEEYFPGHTISWDRGTWLIVTWRK